MAELQQAAPERRVRVLILDGIVVEADRSLLQAALENLLGNAWKFTAKTTVAVIELGAAWREGVFAYFVRDNGAGFDMEYVEGSLRHSSVFTRMRSSPARESVSPPCIGCGAAWRTSLGRGCRRQGATFFWTLPDPRTGV